MSLANFKQSLTNKNLKLKRSLSIRYKNMKKNMMTKNTLVMTNKSKESYLNEIMPQIIKL